MIVFSSDNGPVLDDGYKDEAVEGAEHPNPITLHGQTFTYRPAPHLPAGPYRGGKYSIFDGGTKVPFIVSWQGTYNAW